MQRPMVRRCFAMLSLLFSGHMMTLVHAASVATPTFSPASASGPYTASVKVTIATTTAGATIRYTTNGAAPTSASAVYGGPLTLTTTTTIKARANIGTTYSALARATYTVLQPAAMPTLSPTPGAYPVWAKITIASTTTGAIIRYTTNGSVPTSTSTLYTGPVAVTATATISAKAYKTGMSESPPAAGLYTITPARSFLTTFTLSTPYNDIWQVDNNQNGGPGGPLCINNVPQPGTNVRFMQAGNVTLTDNGYQITTPAFTKTQLYTSYYASGSCLQGSGGQVETRQPVYFGWFEATMLTSPASGAVNGFFVYGSDENEIDIEVLSRQNDVAAGQGLVNLTVHLPGGRERTAVVRLVDRLGRPIKPWSEFYRYGFYWRPDNIEWYVDGVPVTIQSCRDERSKAVPPSACFSGTLNVPQLPGVLIANNWSNGASWSGPQPTTDAFFFVRSVSYTPW